MALLEPYPPLIRELCIGDGADVRGGRLHGAAKLRVQALQRRADFGDRDGQGAGLDRPRAEPGLELGDRIVAPLANRGDDLGDGLPDLAEGWLQLADLGREARGVLAVPVEALEPHRPSGRRRSTRSSTS